MDNQFILTQEELAFFVYHNQRGILLGISDPFAEMSGSEKTKQLMDVEQGLIARGICKPVFGGKLKLSPEHEDMLKICTGFEQYIGLDWKKASEPPETKRFYKAEGKWVSISDQEEGVCLSLETPGTVKSILTKYPKPAQDSLPQQYIQLQKRVLNELTRLIQNGEQSNASSFLADKGISAAEQRLIMKVICGETDLFILTLCSCTEGAYKLETVSVAVEDGVLWEWYQAVDSSDRTVFGLKCGGPSELDRLWKEAQQWLKVL